MEWEVNVFYIYLLCVNWTELKFQWIDRLVNYCRPEIHSLDRVVIFLQCTRPAADCWSAAQWRFTWPIGVYLTDRGFNLSFEFEFEFEFWVVLSFFEFHFNLHGFSWHSAPTEWTVRTLLIPQFCSFSHYFKIDLI